MSEPYVITLGESDLIAWVDQEDAQVAGMGWYAKKAGHAPFFHYYACSRHTVGRTRIDYFLHNIVWERMMGTPLPKGFLVDHINGDKLDNRRDNLRLATRSDNEANKKKRRTQSGGATTSRYKGVNKPKGRKRWRSTITFQHRQIALGMFDTEREAAEAYNKAALMYYGEFAYINEFEEDSNG
jgi:hypothetical protein